MQYLCQNWNKLLGDAVRVQQGAIQLVQSLGAMVALAALLVALVVISTPTFNGVTCQVPTTI